MLFRVIRWLCSGYNLVIIRKEGTNPPSSESSGGGLSRVSFRRVLLGSGGCPKSRGVLDCVQATVTVREDASNLSSDGADEDTAALRPA